MAVYNKGNRLEENSLYVNHLPGELDEDGITKMFNIYGSVTAIIAPPGAKYAFISYGTYAEAEAAIRGLDNKAPLYLHVQFRRKKTETTNGNGQRNGQSVVNGQNGNVQGIYGERPSHIHPDFRYMGPALPPPPPLVMSQFQGRPRPEMFHTHMSPTIYSPQYRTQSPVVPPQNGFFQYTPMELQYAERNDLWSRGSMVLDSAGRRHVSMGRGYTRYQVSEPHTYVEEQIGKVSEIRRRGIFQYSTDQHHEKIGRCLACGKFATQTCSSCNKHYCNYECQVNDWDRHQRSDCHIKMPVLNNIPCGGDSLFTPLTPLTPLTPGDGYSKLLKTRSITLQPPQPLRKPKHLVGDEIIKNTSPKVTSPLIIEKKNIEDITSVEKLLIKSPEKIEKLNFENLSIKNQTFASKIDDVVQEKVKQVEKLPEKISEVAKVQNNRFIVAEPDMNFSVSTQNYLLSKTEFVVCLISNVELSGHLLSVQRCCDIEAINNLMIDLNNITLNLNKVQRPEIDKIYGVQYANIWHRGQVISLDPIKIDFIDYGGIEIIDENDCEFLNIGEYADKPRYSINIRLPKEMIDQYRSLEVDSLISVKMIGSHAEDDIIDVIVKSDEITDVNELQEIVAEKKVEKVTDILTIDILKDDSPPSVIDKIIVGSKIIASIAENVEDNIAHGVLFFEAVNEMYDELLEPLRIACDKLAPTAVDYKPKINDFVCFQKADDPIYWLRGIVMSIEVPIKIASIDEGIHVTTCKIIPIPDNFKNIPMFAVQLSTKTKFPASQDESVDLNIKSVGSIVEGVCVNSKLTVEISKWTPWASSLLMTTSSQKKIPSIDIKNNSKVIIQCHVGPSVVYLRSLDQNEIERSNRLIQDVAKAAQTAIKLTKLPTDGDYILAKFVDDNFYRAQVLAIENDKIKVVYIDYGNTEVTELDKLRVFPKSLIEFPLCITKATLKGIKTTPPTKEASDYLATFAGNEEELTCIFDVSLMDGVTLKTSTNEIVNDRVNELLKPSWENKDGDAPIENKSLFFLTNIEMAKLGEIGETKKCILIHILESGSKYVFAPYDQSLLAQMIAMPDILKEYCDAHTEFYIPRVGELCIAFFDDGNWYRGCCINPSAEPNSALILFLDYGNMANVKHALIRKMTQDFLQPPAIGIICNTNFSTNKKTSTDIVAKLDRLMIPNESYKIKIVSIDEDSEYAIEIPDVQAELDK